MIDDFFKPGHFLTKAVRYCVYGSRFAPIEEFINPAQVYVFNTNGKEQVYVHPFDWKFWWKLTKNLLYLTFYHLHFILRIPVLWRRHIK